MLIQQPRQPAFLEHVALHGLNATNPFWPWCKGPWGKNGRVKAFKNAFKVTLGIEATTHMLKVAGIMQAKLRGVNDSTLAVITGMQSHLHSPLTFDAFLQVTKCQPCLLTTV